jgi:hypothetical protein
MTVRCSDTGIVILEGACGVEDAEPLLQLLQVNPAPAVDWTTSSHLHTAVVQVILASGIAPKGPCGDSWVREWVAPELRQQAARG